MLKKLIPILVFYFISFNSYANNYQYMYSKMLSQSKNEDSTHFINILKATSDNIQHLSDYEKVAIINKVINVNIGYTKDINLWGETDYWASPYETFTKMAGDCEDFAIAKYFVLKSLGIPEEKLKFTYTIIKETNERHFVLSYYELPYSEPLILGNMKDSIDYMKDRTDLFLVYSFNKEAYWVKNDKYDADKISNYKFKNLLIKMNIENMYNSDI